MKFLIYAILVLLVAVGLALIAHNDPGYILISRGPWKVETTLALALLLLVLGLVVFYYFIRFIVNTWLLPRRLRAWSRRRQSEKARAALTHGLLQLEEGKWQAAEQTLIESVPASETPLLNYLGAARSAQRQGAHDRRDSYLDWAKRSAPDASVAVDLTRAELQLSHHQTEQALATLKELCQSESKHPYALQLLLRLHTERQDWKELLELLPELQKRKVVSTEEANALEVQAYAGLLTKVADVEDRQALYVLWDSIPKRVKFTEPVLLTYLQQLCARGEQAQAETLLRDALKRGWSERLVYLYGLVQGGDPAKQLDYAEDLLKKHENDSVLLLTLGRLSLGNRLWGKAQGYLEASIGASARAETYQELGNLLDQMGEREGAREAYRKGLQLTMGKAFLVPFAGVQREVMAETPPPAQEAVNPG